MATTPTTPPPPPSPGSPAPAPTKKRTSPLVWVLVGCGALLLLLALALLIGGLFVAKKVKDVVGDVQKNPAMAAAKLVAAANPDIEVVSADEDGQTVTFRNRKTGEVMTVSLEDVKKGRVTFTTGKGEQVTVDSGGDASGTLRIESDKGEVTFMGGGEEDFPAFLPRYPGLRLQSTMTGNVEGSVSRLWQFRSDDAPERVLEFYRREMEAKGFTVTVNTTRQGGRVSGGMLHAVVDGDEQMLNVVATAAGAGSEGTIAFQMRRRE